MLHDRVKIDVDNLSINFLNKKFIDRHYDLWNSMAKKYEFLDKNIKFDDAVDLTKEILNEQLKNVEKAKTLKIYLRQF